MAGFWHLGNDLVDLTAPRTSNRAPSVRFMNRVFTRDEQDLMAGSPHRDWSVWVFWAAKEAVFKSVTKALESPPVFHHTAFRIHFPPEALERLAEVWSTGSEEVEITGSGMYGELSWSLAARCRQEYIHALSWWEDGRGIRPEVLWKETRAKARGQDGPEAVRSRFSALEWACISHETSALSRLEARRAVAGCMGVEESRLEIRCGPGTPGRRIPLLYLDDEPLALDLTLSHDGPFLGCAFLKEPL